MSFYKDKSAEIGENVSVGYNSFIGPDVSIGDGCVIGCGVIIHQGTIIGSNIRIDDNTVLGKFPMKAANSATTKDQELPVLIISDDCIIGTSTVIYRGARLGKRVLIADLATVRENVEIGDYTIIGRGVAVENFCKIGSYCKLETNVYVTAYSEIGDRVFIAPCVATSNDNFVGRTEERFKHFKGITVKKGARIGVGAVILPGKTIGEDALIAAGALLTKDAEPRKIVAGVPGKEFRDVPSEQLLENQDW
ncbi:MAG: DapH/DapD/GlmU-related protein [candidate division Zixibacteria bacterium]